MRISSLFAALAIFAFQSSAATPEQFFHSIRSGDAAGLQRQISEGDLNKADSRGTTPLHYAAVVGNVASLKQLLNAEAVVDPRNTMEATPLILAASSPEKVHLLLAAGADPKARTKAGRTALIIAAGRAGSTESVRALIAAGADVNAVDEQGTTPLLAAAAGGDMATIRLLLERGAEPDISDKAGFTALIESISTNEIDRVRLFLSKGADVNASNKFAGVVRHGKIALTGMTPLILAAAHGNAELIRALLSAGAKVNVQDGRGMSPLMVAVASEKQDASVIRMLIAAGADVNAKDRFGETVLDWARKSSNPSTLSILDAQASPKANEASALPVRTRSQGTAAEAVDQGLKLLQSSSTEFFKQSGCVACHHQPMTARAQAAAIDAGFPVASESREEHQRSLTITRPLEPALLQFIEPGGQVDTVANTLFGFAAAGLPANSLTDAAVNYIAGKQRRDGSWTMFGISRAPFEESTITRTAVAVKALKAYGWAARQGEFDERIARARAWMLKAEPRTSYERADLLFGLRWAGASSAELARVAKALLREQRPDGGWSQNRYMASDAYATGAALAALHEGGRLRPSDPAYKHGVDYLLSTRSADGSWHVQSRSAKFQPYFESGFPHAHDQWISVTATAYAVMALAPAGQSHRSNRTASNRTALN